MRLLDDVVPTVAMRHLIVTALLSVGPLHMFQYLHRDVNPEKFLLGMGIQGNTVYMTDLGLAIYHHPDRWSSNSAPSRIVTARPPELLGTCRYASINGHLRHCPENTGY
jgi:hypothetical protein